MLKNSSRGTSPYLKSTLRTRCPDTNISPSRNSLKLRVKSGINIEIFWLICRNREHLLPWGRSLIRWIVGIESIADRTVISSTSSKKRGISTSTKGYLITKCFPFCRHSKRVPWTGRKTIWPIGSTIIGTTSVSTIPGTKRARSVFTKIRTIIRRTIALTDNKRLFSWNIEVFIEVICHLKSANIWIWRKRWGSKDSRIYCNIAHWTYRKNFSRSIDTQCYNIIWGKWWVGIETSKTKTRIIIDSRINDETIIQIRSCSNTDVSIVSIDPVSDIELIGCSVGNIRLSIVSDEDIIVSRCKIVSSIITKCCIITSGCIISECHISKRRIVRTSSIGKRRPKSICSIIASRRIWIQWSISVCCIAFSSSITVHSIHTICCIVCSNRICKKCIVSYCRIIVSCCIGCERLRSKCRIPYPRRILHQCTITNSRIVPSCCIGRKCLKTKSRIVPSCCIIKEWSICIRGIKTSCCIIEEWIIPICCIIISCCIGCEWLHSITCIINTWTAWGAWIWWKCWPASKSSCITHKNFPNPRRASHYFDLSVDFKFCSGVCHSNTDVSIVSIDPVSDIELIGCSIRNIRLSIVSDEDIIVSGKKSRSCIDSYCGIIIPWSITRKTILSYRSIVSTNTILIHSTWSYCCIGKPGSICHQSRIPHSNSLTTNTIRKKGLWSKCCIRVPGILTKGYVSKCSIVCSNNITIKGVWTHCSISKSRSEWVKALIAKSRVIWTCRIISESICSKGCVITAGSISCKRTYAITNIIRPWSTRDTRHRDTWPRCKSGSITQKYFVVAWRSSRDFDLPPYFEFCSWSRCSDTHISICIIDICARNPSSTIMVESVPKWSRKPKSCRCRNDTDRNTCSSESSNYLSDRVTLCCGIHIVKICLKGTTWNFSHRRRNWIRHSSCRWWQKYRKNECDGKKKMVFHTRKYKKFIEERTQPLEAYQPKMSYHIR